MNILLTNDILMRSLVLFLMLGSIAGLLAGALMMWRPEWLSRISKYANRWVSTRQMARPLQQQFNIDQRFYRYGYLSGLLLLLCGLYIVYMFLIRVVRTDLLSALGSMHWVQPALVGPLLDTLVLVSLMGAILAMLVGLFLVFRPSMLRDFEFGANQNITLRQSLKPMEMQHAGLDKLVLRNARLTGVLLTCGSIYSLVALAFWLGR